MNLEGKVEYLAIADHVQMYIEKVMVEIICTENLIMYIIRYVGASFQIANEIAIYNFSLKSNYKKFQKSPHLIFVKTICIPCYFVIYILDILHVLCLVGLVTFIFYLVIVYRL